MNPASKPEISVLIPAYNGAPWIAETLSRLAGAAGGIPLETLIVDNASTDETASICRRQAEARLLPNEANLGFSCAVNRAARSAQGEILVVINQDLYLEPGALKTIREFSSSKKAVVGGALSFQDGSSQASCGPFPSFWGTLWRLLLPKSIRKNHILPLSAEEAQPVDWVTGAFIAFPRELFDRIGGFDEGYFMYYEDVDFCLRARRAGFPSYFLPSAKAVHVNPHSARGDVPAWLRQEIRRSQVTYFSKHRPGWEHQAVRAINRAYFAAHGWPWPEKPAKAV